MDDLFGGVAFGKGRTGRIGFNVWPAAITGELSGTGRNALAFIRVIPGFIDVIGKKKSFDDDAVGSFFQPPNATAVIGAVIEDHTAGLLIAN